MKGQRFFASKSSCGSIALGLSILLNLMLLGQMVPGPDQDTLGPTLLRGNAPIDSRVSNTSPSKLSDLPAEDIINLGSMFLLLKASIVTIDMDVEKDKKAFPLEDWEKKITSDKATLAGGPALDLLSVSLSQTELDSQVSLKTASSISSRLDKIGMVVLPAVFDKELCKQVALTANREIRDPWIEYSSIAENEFRKDYALPLDGEMYDMLKRALTILKPAFDEMIGQDAVVVEFSSLTAYPGSPAQHWHHDSSPDTESDYYADARLFSGFVYLDDIGQEVAPFDARPGTHSKYLVKDFADPFIESSTAVRLAVPAGTIALYDSRLLHRGGPNTSDLTRPTLYFSVLELNGKRRPDGPTYSMRDGYRETPVVDIVAGRVPKQVATEAQQSHDDEKCLKSIRRICPDAKYECVERKLNRELRRQGEASLSLEKFGHERLQKLAPGCSLSSRMQKLCQAFIFSPNFKTKFTWGAV